MKTSSRDTVKNNFFVSQSNLDRQFKKYLSLSPKKYLDAKKLLYSKQLIEEGKTVTEACFESGFNDCSRFINLFKEKFNDTPFKINNKFFKDKKYSNIKFKAMCDVTNPLYGPLGCSYIFARQKGADDDMIKRLDENIIPRRTPYGCVD